MKIYINGRFLSQRITGVQRYAREIVCALDNILQDYQSHDEFYILAPKNIIEELPTEKIKLNSCGYFTGHIWEQLELPFYARDGFLVNLCNCAPLIKKNQLLTVHDAAVAVFPQAYSWKFRTWYKIIYTICGKRIDKLATVSEFSRNELNKYFNIDKEKVAVISNAVEHMDRIDADESILDEFNLHDEKFVLAVSSQNPTKNFPLVLKAAKLLPNVKFVIVGGSNKSIFAGDNVELLANVSYTGYVSDEKLLSLYRQASVFVYPSLYEGFGIPPLEAMSQGCPTIVSSCASLPEVCGNYAFYCDHDNEVDVVNKILEILSGKYEGNKFVGIREKYSWQKSAQCLLDYIKS